jgi:hypothetical protein
MGRLPDRGLAAGLELKHLLPQTELRRGVGQPPNRFLALEEGSGLPNAGLGVGDPESGPIPIRQASWVP